MSSAEFIKVFVQSQENPAVHWGGYLRHPLREKKKEKRKKESLGIDTLVVDQATPHHMIFPALLTVCEEAIHLEWIGSAVYHHKICDAPINTQDVQTFIIASFFSLSLQHPARDVTAASFVCTRTHFWISRLCQQDKSTHACIFCFLLLDCSLSLSFFFFSLLSMSKSAFKGTGRIE